MHLPQAGRGAVSQAATHVCLVTATHYEEMQGKDPPVEAILSVIPAHVVVWCT